LHNLFSGNNFVQFVGIVAGILTAASMLPQLIKTFQKKQADDISLIMLVVLMSGIATWIWYGALKNDLPIIFTNSFSLLLNVILMFLRWKYKNKEPYSSP
jgi:MtN3 and saliva related transmembrane protein